MDDLSMFSNEELKSIVQDMRELLSQSHLGILLGAGASVCAGHPLMLDLTKTVLAHSGLSKSTVRVLEQMSALYSNTDNVTIEDYMSEIVDYLSIADRRNRYDAKEANIILQDDQLASASELENSLTEIKQVITQIITEREVNITTHRHFVKVIHGSLQAGKSKRSVDYFILNYDTLIEDALGLERVAYCDGFVGASTGWWEPSLFESDGIATRIFKLHGSIDWCMLEGDFSPRRVRPNLIIDSTAKNVLIYPAATKYLEAQRDPFAQLLGHMRNSISPEGNKLTVLMINGYSFRDPHIDQEVENALYKSEGRLTVAAFIGEDEPSERLQKWLSDPIISEQIRIYANKGYYHGSKCYQFEKDIPWWKFEVLARILGGER